MSGTDPHGQARADLEAQLQAWMLAAISGDRDSYERLLTRVGTMVRAYLMNWLNFSSRSPEKVEDLVQDVLLAIHKKKHLYRTDMPILPWIYAIAKYRLIDSIRAEKRRPQTVQWIDSWEEDFESATLGAASEAENTPESYAASQQDGAVETEELLAGLNPRQKQILLMAKSQEIPLHDIADQLNMSLSAVKVTIHRAVHLLRKTRAKNEKRD